MKARPRSVEREVAAFLTELLNEPIVQIPVLGRTGPDLTYHPPLKLIIDVKSRKQVPLAALAGDKPLITADGLLGIRLENLSDGRAAFLAAEQRPASRIVRGWWNHMDEWTRANEPDGISAIILHRPRMPIGHATVIINCLDRSKLCQRLAEHVKK
jgi:hypothetical protein